MSNPPNDGQPTEGTPQWGNPADGTDNDAAASPYTQQGGSKFGTEAYSAGSYGGPIAEPDKFRKLKLFTLISGGIFLLWLVVEFVASQSEDFQAQMQETYDAMGMQITAEEIEQIAGFFAGAVVVVGVIGIILYLLVFLGLRANKNWARVLGLVLAIISGLFTAFYTITSLFELSGLSMAVIVLGAAQLAAIVYWLVLAFSSDVAQYLQQFKRAA